MRGSIKSHCVISLTDQPTHQPPNQTTSMFDHPRCALHPSMRQDWVAGWERQLVKGGELVTMVYPVLEPSRQGEEGEVQLGGGGVRYCMRRTLRHTKMCPPCQPN
jgi:hypothetical protein